MGVRIGLPAENEYAEFYKGYVARVAHETDGAAVLEDQRRTIDRLRALPDPPARLLEAATDFYRHHQRLEALLERLTEDPALRAKASAKPDQVLRDAGLEPVPELVESLRTQGRESGDLARRIAAKHFWL